ncbi:MAG: GTPase HflX [Lachnospiraceae bacterium]|nr:GTPase HflX [Lachnospiraceae bacterium]
MPIDTEAKKEKVILVAVSERDGDDTADSVKELGELAATAGALVVGTVIQNREKIHPGTYVGTGKIDEIAELLDIYNADGIICDDELSPAQMKNLGNILSCKIMDRTMVILDIFAGRARTGEGKLQVELAQLRYRLNHLTGMGREMSRLGGGIGTRGPGEKKLEMDRRLIRDRISILKSELKDVVRHREINRKQREKNHVPVAAIVGYTNAGKSTLLNALTGASVLSEDMVFATLDPTTRMLALDNKQEILLTDTVGFIRKLPHHLIEAFKSTLEEAKYADIIIHVVDASNPEADKQMYIVYETLNNLGVEGKKIITLFNKWDLRRERLSCLTEEEKTTDEGLFFTNPIKDFRADKTLEISAAKGEGLDELKLELADFLREDKVYVERVLPFDKAGLIQSIRKTGELLEETYEADGIHIKAYVTMETYGKLP